MTIKNLIAKMWRREYGYTGKGGVVVMFEGEVNGWVNKLRDPQCWRPGCTAIDELGNEFVTTGGNVQDGAANWDKYESTQSKR